MKRSAWMLAVGSLIASKAFALNILLSNDDGYQHPNIRALYTALKAAGHNVKVAAPQSDQSARGGAFFFGREVSVGHDSDPAYPDSYFISTHEKGPHCTGLLFQQGRAVINRLPAPESLPVAAPPCRAWPGLARVADAGPPARCRARSG